MRNMPTFAPRAVQVKFSVQEDDSAVEYHYTSHAQSIRNVDEPQAINIYPSLILARQIRLDLLGKYNQQASDQLFYTVLKRVRCFGVPMVALASLKLRTVTLALLKWYSHMKAAYQTSECELRTDAGLDRVYGLMSLTGLNYVKWCTGKKEMFARIRASFEDGTWQTTVDELFRRGVCHQAHEIYTRDLIAFKL